MNRFSGFVEKIEFFECVKSRKFNGKLCTFDVQNIWIRGKIRIH